MFGVEPLGEFDDLSWRVCYLDKVAADTLILDGGAELAFVYLGVTAFPAQVVATPVIGGGEYAVLLGFTPMIAAAGGGDTKCDQREPADSGC